MLYDAAGRLTEKREFYGTHGAKESYRYTGFGELAAVYGDMVTALYSYGPDGYRTGKTVNGVATHYVYDGMNIIGEQVDGITYTEAGDAKKGYA